MKYKVKMTYHRNYYVEIDMQTEAQAREHARFYLSPEDCEADEYFEWEVDSVHAQEQTT